MRRLHRYDAPLTEEALRFQRALEDYAPPGGRLSWFRLLWIPGRDDSTPSPVQRWGIYQMVPAEHAPRVLIVPGPRRGEAILYRPFLNRQARRLYDETHCYGKLIWIIQGPPGGHAHHEGMPLPGDLPYRAPDHSILASIRERDLVNRNRENRFLSLERSERDRKRMKHAMRKRQWDAWEDEVFSSEEGYTHAQRQAIDDEWKRRGRYLKDRGLLTLGDEDPLDEERIRNDFIHSED